MARSAPSKSAQRPAWGDRVSLVGVAFGLVSTTLAMIVGRATGAGWTAAIGLAVLLGAGIYLWAADESKSWGDLGQGVVVSVVVAISLMAVQRDADTRRERAAARESLQRDRAADRQSLQLTLTMGDNNLRGVSLPDRDMHDFFLAEKRLDRANLAGADLTGADLRGSSLTWANLAGAKLDGAQLVSADLMGATFDGSQDNINEPPRPAASLRGADLQGAWLNNASLSGADLAGAILMEARLQEAILFEARLGGAALIFADLRDTRLEGTDLRRSRLGGATFCGANLRGVRLNGALYDDATRWPSGFDPSRHGARRTARSDNTPEAELASEFETPDGRGGGLYRRAYPRC